MCTTNRWICNGNGGWKLLVDGCPTLIQVTPTQKGFTLQNSKKAGEYPDLTTAMGEGMKAKEVVDDKSVI